MRPIDIFTANSYGYPVINTRVSDFHHKIDYYASLPPPPPYTSLCATDKNKQYFPIDQLQDPYGTNEALVSLQHVKDYLLKIKSLSPMHETISPTDNYPDIKPKSITNSSNYNSQSNNAITDFSINEGLERIGATLQHLIDEAQASLLRKPSEKPISSTHFYSEEEENIATTPSLANYSYQYVQKRYMHSQEKISVAFEQLEQSIQNMTFNTITTPSSNGIPKSHYTKKSFIHEISTNKIKYLAMFGTFTTIMVILFSKHSKQKKSYKILSLLLFFLSICFRKNKEMSVVNTMDKFIIRMLMGHNDQRSIYRKS